MMYGIETRLPIWEAKNLYNILDRSEFFIVIYSRENYAIIYHKNQAMEILGYERKGKSLAVYR